jgi:serine/threonine-protein kinase
MMTSISHPRSSFFDLQLKDRVMIGELPYIVEGAARGGMGCVILLWQDAKNCPTVLSALGLKVALKAILPEAADAEGLSLFKRELTVWAGLRHPNIVSLIEIVDGGDAGWVAAMHWCPGSLRDVMTQRGKLPLRDATMILANLIDGLSYAFKQDRVHHLDLKPENVLYHLDFNRLMGNQKPDDASLEKFRFMLADWGIASIKQPKLNAIAGLPPSAGAALTTFNNMGTLLYMAPERFLRGYTSSSRSDVFSLGIMYLEMLTGKRPFVSGVNPVESLISGRYIIDATSIMKQSGIPMAVGQLILQMIAHNPEKRPSDYSSLGHDLLRCWKKSSGIFSRSFK